MRSKFLGSHVPKNDTIASVDQFVLAGLKRPGSTPYSIMNRNSAISEFMKGYGRSALASTAVPCGAATLVHSKYEMMVTNFSDWAALILAHMVAPKGQRKSLHTTLCAAMPVA